MPVYQVITLLISCTALLAYINTRWIRLPNTIGLMLLSIILSLVLGGMHHFFPQSINPIVETIQQMDFSKIVFNILLSFLLFAGSLHTDFTLLKSQKISVILFAVLGVIFSTFILGSIFYFLVQCFGITIPYIYCLLFGSFISPTDPIAVLGILTKAGIPKKIEINIVGESLFNDGIGIVLFITILSILHQGLEQVTFTDIIFLFCKEALGGILLGTCFGYILGYLLKSIDDYETELLLTLAVVMGGSFLASVIHVSGPLAMVVAGLLTGHNKQTNIGDDITAYYVEKFWHLVDVLLNAVLFVLMGFVLFTIESNWNQIGIALCIIPCTILARYISLFLPYLGIKRWISIRRVDLIMITWGGLRGGLSIAMALSLPIDIPYKNLFVTCTYGIVIFSIFIQGLTQEQLVKRLYRKELFD